MQTQMYVPPLTKFNKTLIIAVVAVFIVNSILRLQGIHLLPWFGLSWNGLTSGLLYQPFTYMLMESSLIAVVFNCLLIWFIGSELEQKWGQRFYWQYLLICSLASAVVFAIAGVWGFGQGVLYGMGGVTYALLIAYAMIYSDRQMTFMLIFPMKAKYFCMLLVGIELYMSIFSAQGPYSLVHLASMATGYFYLKTLSLKAKGKPISFWPEMKKKKKKRDDARRKFYIVTDDEKQKADPKDPRFWQ